MFLSSIRGFPKTGILHFVSQESIISANSAYAEKLAVNSAAHQRCALTSTCFIRGVGGEVRNAVGNTEATPQREPMVTDVTSVPAAALQARPRAGCPREDTVDEAQPRHRHPVSTSRDPGIKGWQPKELEHGQQIILSCNKRHFSELSHSCTGFCSILIDNLGRAEDSLFFIHCNLRFCTWMDCLKR